MIRMTAEALRELIRKPGYRDASGAGLTGTPCVPVSSQPVTAGTRWTITLPFPPTLNHNTMPAKNGGRYLTQKYRDFRAEVCRIVEREKPTAIGNRFRMELELHYPDKRRRDADNAIKSCLDSLQLAAVISNDHWLRELYVKVIESAAPGPGKAVVTCIEL